MAEKTTKKKTVTKPVKAVKTTKAAKSTAPVKSTRTRATKTVSAKVEKPSVEEPKTEKGPISKAVRVKKSYFFTFLGIVLFVVVVVLLRNLVTAATVNGQSISRLSVISELEKQGGKQALDSLITKSLIIQEAQKKNVQVTQKDIDGEMKKIQTNLTAQGQTLDQVLQLQGMTKDQLTEQIKLQKMIEKMVKPAAVTDAEVTAYMEANKDSLPQDQDEKTLRASIKDRLQQQKLNDEAQKFLDTLRKSAKINYYVKY
jgi:hypothetical protein